MKITKAINIINGYTDNDEDSEELGSPFGSESVQNQSAEGATKQTPALDTFGIDITSLAEEGKLDPVVGREVEIERVVQILSRRKKNNPVLIGEPGVGKTAIVEGLAQRIVNKKVSRVLFDKRVVNLDLASVVAGTKYRGQFEERIKAILNELKHNPNIILFIDEIHTIVGAGSAAGSMDAANMLKPALARGLLQCIGATTLDEYRKSIEKDGALERRFQKIIVSPPSLDETREILKSIKANYEEHHNVHYTEDAIEQSILMGDKFITDRSFPDKAIDILDEAGARVHVAHITIPQEIKDLEVAIDHIRQEKISAAKQENFEKATNLRDAERDMLLKLEEAKKNWEQSIRLNREKVDEDTVREVVSMMTGIPQQRVAKNERERLLELGDNLKQRVIGQDTAVDKIVKAIQRNRVGLRDSKMPIGTFLFLGPTGVGKTHLAKQLSKVLFDDENAMIRVDMSEYMEKFAVSRLIGAPPGYVGYDEGGQLTERVRRKPYSVILLDEIEKAHTDVYNILLQVMDDGVLTDSVGRKIDFKNTIIIMTSNVGTRQLKEFGKGVGFQVGETNQEYSRSVIRKALNRTFSPEFLNRIDDIVLFDQLEKDSIRKIARLELEPALSRAKELGFVVTINDDAIDFLVEKGYDVQFGARPLKRAISEYVEEILTDAILRGTIEKDIPVELVRDNEHLVIQKDNLDNNITTKSDNE